MQHYLAGWQLYYYADTMVQDCVTILKSQMYTKMIMHLNVLNRKRNH